MRPRGRRAINVRALDIANSSTNELDYLLLLARDVGYLDEKEHAAFIESLRGWNAC